MQKEEEDKPKLEQQMAFTDFTTIDEIVRRHN